MALQCSQLIAEHGKEQLALAASPRDQKRSPHTQVKQLMPGSPSSHPRDVVPAEAWKQSRKLEGGTALVITGWRYWAHVLRPCYLPGRWRLAGGLGGIANSCHLFLEKGRLTCSSVTLALKYLVGLLLIKKKIYIQRGAKIKTIHCKTAPSEAFSSRWFFSNWLALCTGSVQLREKKTITSCQ